MTSTPHPPTCGQRNRSYIVDDLDRIEVLTSTSSASDGPSTRSQYELTAICSSPIMSRRRRSDGYEAIELSQTTAMNQQLYRRHERRTTSICSGVAYRSPTPTNMVRRWSQSISRFSRDRRAYREHGLSRLPSRKVFELHDKLLAGDADVVQEVEQLVGEIEQHEALMEDTAIGQQNRMETLRALPLALSKKRLIKNMLSISVERQSQLHSKRNWPKRLANTGLYVLRRGWEGVHHFAGTLRIWTHDVATIEGNFGSNVSSYFKFLRWLFILNLVLFVCTFTFIIAPQIVFNGRAGHERAGGSHETVRVQQHRTSSWTFNELLAGGGCLNTSLMFYAGYTNASVLFGQSQREYSMPQAYYMTIIILYLSTFVVISISMARSYRKSFIVSIGRMRTLHAPRVLCSWDYSISNRKAAELKHFTIYTELWEWLDDMRRCSQRSTLKCRILKMCTRIIVHLLTLLIIIAFVIVTRIAFEYCDIIEIGPLGALLLSTAVDAAMLALQLLFSWISRMEEFRTPRHALHVTLVRNYLLELATVSGLVHFWLSRQGQECWENALGVEIYRFIMADFLINVIAVPLVGCIHVYVAKHVPITLERPAFDIPQRSVGLVFNQTLLWLGLLFAPILAALMVVKMFIVFYINKMMLFHVCQTPRHAWRSTQAQTFYLLFTFLSLLGVIVTLGYIMTEIAISRRCGPFRDYSYMFQILIDGVFKLREHRSMWLVLTTLVRPAVVCGMLIVLAVMVYYMRAKSHARCVMVRMLKDMLVLEVKDKEFLIATIANMSKARDYGHNDGTATWPRRSHSHQQIDGNTLWRYKHIHESHSETSISEQCSSILRIRNI